MEPRFFIDPSTGEPHIYGHNVTEAEVEDVLARPLGPKALKALKRRRKKS